MSNRFLELLDAKPVLLADGAMGTNLFVAGLQTGSSPEPWNVDHPDRVIGIHEGFVNAGSDIILTNSFGGNRNRLKLDVGADRVGELNEAAARIARRVTDAADRPVAVAGSMGPTGELFEPLGELTPDSALAAFTEQAAALAAGGADVLWVETMSAVEEFEAAVGGAATTGLPVVATMSFDTKRRTMMGIKPDDYTRMCQKMADGPVAWGANCGVGAGELLETVLGLTSVAGPGDVIVAKGNCGIPVFVGDRLTYSGTPEVMAQYARLAVDAGVRIVGGCCGTTHEHMRAMALALKDYTPGKRPELADIEAVFGEVWPKPAA